MSAATMFRLQAVNYVSARRELCFLELPVVKATPKGHWLDYYGSRKFILSAARKKWAYPTKQEALASFIIRKKRQIEILKMQVEDATISLGMAAMKQGQEETLPCQSVRAA
jgi:hypothetical protein